MISKAFAAACSAALFAVSPLQAQLSPAKTEVTNQTPAVASNTGDGVRVGNTPQRWEQPGSTTVDQLERVEAATALLKAQNAYFEEQRRSQAIDASDTLPAIVAIFGAQDNLRARVISPRGTMYKVAVGDSIGIGIKIASITRQGVLVSIANGSGKKASSRELPLTFYTPVAAGGWFSAGTVPGGRMNPVFAGGPMSMVPAPAPIPVIPGR
jgi:hypothetical protein